MTVLSWNEQKYEIHVQEHAFPLYFTHSIVVYGIDYFDIWQKR